MSARVWTRRRALARFLREPSPRILVAASAATLALRVLLGDFGLWDGIVVAAIVLLWPLQEWLLHVYVLHARPFRLFGRTVDLRAGTGHREHHESPLDPDEAFMPPRVLLSYLGFHVAFWLVAMPTWRLGLTGLATMAVLGTAYEWVHFLIHTDYRPRSRWYARIWRSHRLHHFKNEGYWFGVTMLGGDRLMGTRPDPARVATSATCRTLTGGRPERERLVG